MNEWAHEQKKLKSMDIFFKIWELGGQSPCHKGKRNE